MTVTPGDDSKPLETCAIVIPTKNRAEKLDRCLTAISKGLGDASCPVYVCDSSTTSTLRKNVAAVCSKYPFARLSFHSGANVGAARNFCARTATEDLLINVDDDVNVLPDAIANLLDAYRSAPDACVIAGSVAWNGDWSKPIKLRPNGYGRKAKPGERPDFLIGAFFLYPRICAIAWPWPEMIRTSDDRFMGALWRSKGIHLLFAPEARALHDDELVRYDVADQAPHVYVNLFDSLIANRNIRRALTYEVLGFLSYMKHHARDFGEVRRFTLAWFRGHLAFVRDWKALRELVSRTNDPEDRRGC